MQQIIRQSENNPVKNHQWIPWFRCSLACGGWQTVHAENGGRTTDSGADRQCGAHKNEIFWTGAPGGAPCIYTRFRHLFFGGAPGVRRIYIHESATSWRTLLKVTVMRYWHVILRCFWKLPRRYKGFCKRCLDTYFSGLFWIIKKALDQEQKTT